MFFFSLFWATKKAQFVFLQKKFRKGFECRQLFEVIPGNAGGEARKSKGEGKRGNKGWLIKSDTIVQGSPTFGI